MTRVSLDERQVAAVGGGWLQERYYSSDGGSVRDFLSFRSVYEINPFEVGANHSGERAAYKARRDVLDAALGLDPLWRSPLMSLSNGELRRVVLAKALLRERGTVVIDGGCGGLDAVWRRRIREASRALRPLGVRLCIAGAGSSAPRGERRYLSKRGGAAGDCRSGRRSAPVVEMCGIDMALGRRRLFRDFSWTIREGERWTLRGPNGSGKTTLLALITGDSPFAYACDIRVFGKRRGEEGAMLHGTRTAIGGVSSMREAYEGISPERQLDDALRPGVRLLLLDEPCCNMTYAAACRFARRVEAWLGAHPCVASVWVEHRPERIPPMFSLQKSLP
jgi:ABC-type molybdenum transport system ATPase subunit/photorepair protein PhrA